MLLGSFAGAALLLAALGIYGVISYGVSQRARELGIRVALGATGDQVVGLMLRAGLTLAVTGVVVGMAGALVVSKVLRSLLFGVTPFDPAAFGVAISVMIGATVLASWIPARRAARADPAAAMRAE